VPSSRSLSSLSRILLLLVAAAAVVPVLFTPLTPDVASTLFFSRRWLEGAHPYLDFVDYPGPLIFVLGVPIEGLAAVTGWSEWRLVVLALIGLSALSLVLVRNVLQAGAARSEPIVVTTLVGALVTMLASPARDFAQAEHLLVIALLPYALWCARIASPASTAPRQSDAGATTADDAGGPSLGLGLRLGVGLLAAVGLALKPAFLIVYAALLAHVVWSRRSVRVLLATEHLLIACGVAMYALAIVLFAPDYLHRVLPMAYVHHWVHGDAIATLLNDWMVLSVAGSSLALVVLASWMTRDRDWSSLVRICAFVSVATLVAFLAQRDPVPEYFLPVRAFNFLAAWLAASGFVSSLARRSSSVARPSSSLTGPTMAGVLAGQPSRRVRLALMLAARTTVIACAVMPPIVVWSLVAEVQSVDYANARAGLRSPFAEPLLDLVHQRAAGKPIFVLSSSTGPAFPLVNLSGAAWPYRFKSLSFVSIYYKDIDNTATVAYRTPQAQSAGERAFFDAVVEDLTRKPPVLLIVDVTRLKQGFGLAYFDFLTYYRQSPTFDALWRHYRFIDWKKNYQIFEYQPST
jgi:hypothetical protein